MADRSRGKKIDFVHWTGFSGSFLAQGAGTVAQTLFTAQHLPETIMRSRGELAVWLDGAQGGGENIRVGVGFCIVPEGTGSTVLWSPLTDADAPWFYYESFTLAYEEAVADVIDFPVISAVRKVIDSKAMRKIPQTSEIQVVLEQVTVGLASSLNAVFVGRMLNGHA